jgi:hypothetical protein
VPGPNGEFKESVVACAVATPIAIANDMAT